MFYPLGKKFRKTLWGSGRYFIYDYYYVPKHTYYYCTIYNTIYTPIQFYPYGLGNR